MVRAGEAETVTRNERHVNTYAREIVYVKTERKNGSVLGEGMRRKNRK